MIVADTSAWIDCFNGVLAPHTDRLDSDLDSLEEHLVLKVRR